MENRIRSTHEVILKVYDELRNLASQHLARESPGQTLCATSLVHETYDRLAKGNREWDSTGHFFGAAASAMRQILVDEARRKKAVKHGGGRRRIEMENLKLGGNSQISNFDALIDFDAALRAYEAEYPVKANLVELRYFAGLSLRDAAAELEISESTAKRYWNFSKAWLTEKLS